MMELDRIGSRIGRFRRRDRGGAASRPRVRSMPVPPSSFRALGVVAALLAPITSTQAQPAREEAQPLRLAAISFADLPGWSQENPAELLGGLIANCNAIRAFRDRPLGGEGFVAERAGTAANWTEACDAIRALPATLPRIVPGDGRRTQAAARARNNAMRGMLERHFAAYAAGPGVMTGYYEPVLRGATAPSETHRTPLLAPPPELGARPSPILPASLPRGPRPNPVPDRAAIEDGALSGRSLEIVWVDDAADAYFLHIQGSGRVMLPDGTMLRIGFAAQNGHPYVPLARVALEAGMPRDRLSMQGMRAWLREVGAERASELMRRNPSYIFFRRVEGLSPEQGPIGAMGVPLTPRRSVAVDRAFIPLGLPLFVAARDPLDRRPFGRIVLAQDTGGQIRGATRTDFFWGWGDEAGERAGRMYEEAQVFLLLPRPAPLERIEVAQLPN